MGWIYNDDPFANRIELKAKAQRCAALLEGGSLPSRSVPVSVTAVLLPIPTSQILAQDPPDRFWASRFIRLPFDPCLERGQLFGKQAHHDRRRVRRRSSEPTFYFFVFGSGTHRDFPILISAGSR